MAKVLALRLNDDELEFLERAAKADRLKLSTWIKRAAMKAADDQQPKIAVQELDMKASNLQ